MHCQLTRSPPPATSHGDLHQSVFVTQAKVLSTFVVPSTYGRRSRTDDGHGQQPVGTGPYVLKTFTPQTVTLDVRTSGYWQALPKVAQLRYTTYSGNDTETQALVTGATEWSYVFIRTPRLSSPAATRITSCGSRRR